jgi:fructose-1,6-bisphosphatase/inositol monophosphatase family enzyme
MSKNGGMDIAAEAFAVSLAKQAGELMRANFSLGTKKTWKEDHSPLTVTDVAINEMVIEAIQETYPGHAVIGEEESYGDTATAEWVWVCDPVDGTIPFSHGFPTFAFSLGLAHHGEPVLGVIHDPFLDRLVTARKGEGARLNGEPVVVGEFSTLERTVVGMEAPSHFIDGSQMRTALRELGAHAVTFNSFVYEGMLCALGEFSGVLYGHRFPWDACALDIIIREAGGVVSGLKGTPNKYNGMIEGFVAAANADLHRQLIELIAVEYH